MMTDHIRILCADDTDIAAEGMQRILEHEPGIQVVGALTQRDAVVPSVLELRPDIVLLDLKWGGVLEAGFDILKEIKLRSPETHIIAITIYDYLIQGAKQAGADDVVTKDISARDLIARIKAITESMEQLRKAREQIVKLSQIPVGDWRSAQRHEACILELLRYCFEPDLTGWQPQVCTFGHVERPDIVCSNFSQLPFWATMRQRHDAQQIVFQLKNSAKLTKKHLEQISLSLGGQRGRLGFLIGRSSPGPNFRRAVYMPYDRFGVVILVLADSDFEEMVNLRAQGQDPTDVVVRHYEEFVRPYAGR